MLYADLIRKYQTQKSKAFKRGIEWQITFEEWCQIWSSSGKWEFRGKGAGRYCMARRLDEGPYSKANVYITTNDGNTRDFHSWNQSEYTGRGEGGRFTSIEGKPDRPPPIIRNEATKEPAMPNEWKLQTRGIKQARLDQVRQFYHSGLKVAQIGRRLGVTRQRAHQLLKEAGCK
jgi:hypothetical protein